jgi:hypothetical protein
VSTPRWWAAWGLDLAPFAPFDVVNEKVTERKKRKVQEPNVSTGAKYFLFCTFLHFFKLNKNLHHPRYLIFLFKRRQQMADP